MCMFELVLRRSHGIAAPTMQRSGLNARSTSALSQQLVGSVRSQTFMHDADQKTMQCVCVLHPSKPIRRLDACCSAALHMPRPHSPAAPDRLTLHCLASIKLPRSGTDCLIDPLI